MRRRRPAPAVLVYGDRVQLELHVDLGRDRLALVADLRLADGRWRWTARAGAAAAPAAESAGEGLAGAALAGVVETWAGVVPPARLRAALPELRWAARVDSPALRALAVTVAPDDFVGAMSDAAADPRLASRAAARLAGWDPDAGGLTIAGGVIPL